MKLRLSAFIMCILLSLSICQTSDAAIKVVVKIIFVEVNDTTIVIHTSIKAVTKNDVGQDFTGTLANIGAVTDIVPFIKTQVINFIQSHFSVTVADTEIAIFNAPQ